MLLSSLSHAWVFATLWTAACETYLSFTVSQSLLRLMSIVSTMASNHLILSPPPPPALILSSIMVFSNESALCIRWPNTGASVSASVLPMNTQGWLPLELTGLISWQSKGAVSSTTIWKHLQHSTFFMVQLSYQYMTTGKTIALTVWTFVSKVMSLLFNKLSRFVIVFFPRSKHLLSSWLQSPSTVILGSKKIKSVTVSIFSPSICHEVMGPHAMILVFWMLSFKPAFSLSSFTLIKRLFSSSLFSSVKVVSSAYLWLMIFLLTILIPASDSSSLAFHTMYSAYKLNKQGDNIQPWNTLSQFRTSPLFHVQF